MPDLEAIAAQHHVDMGPDPYTVLSAADHGNLCLTDRQRMLLSNPLNPDRIAHRRGDGKQLSYLEAWDVKAHLTRCFGFCGWDSHIHHSQVIDSREYIREDYEGPRDNRKLVGTTAMIEVIYKTECTLSVKCQHGIVIAAWTEGAVGQANMQASNASRGDAYDNALKQAASDALKRCAISLGTQFGLSLYNNGAVSDVVGPTLMDPEFLHTPTPQQNEQLAASLGVKVEGGETSGE